jgi:hypothetical protein
MTATAHALVGGAIAASVQNPALGISLAFISHPILDMIPHWDLGIGWRGKNRLTLLIESGMDLIVGMLLAFFIFGSGVNPFYFLACIFASEIWDLMMMPHLLWGWNGIFKKVYSMQHKIQSNTKGALVGILTQVGTVLIISLALRTVRF